MNKDNNIDRQIAAVSKTIARYAAVCFAYQLILDLQPSTDDIHKSFDLLDIEDMPEMNKKYFGLLCKAQNIHSDYIKNNTQQLISSEKTFSDLPILYQAIIIAAGSELKECDRTPTKVIINEYTNIANSIINETAVGFINAILDKLAALFRTEK